MMLNKYLKKENYVHNLTVEWRRKHIYSTLLRENKDYIHGKCLFLGCNSGSTLPLVKEYCDTVTGIDINKRAIHVAKEKIKVDGIDFIVGDIIRMPFEDNSFDTIFMFDVLEHIYEKDQDQFLREVRRVLKYRGHLIFFTPHLGGKRDDIALDPTHVVFFRDENSARKPLETKFKLLKIINETRSNPGNPEQNHDAWFGVCKKIRKLTILCGQVWSGKTTLAKQIELNNEDMVYVDFDTLYHYMIQYLFKKDLMPGINYLLEKINTIIELNDNAVVDGWFSWCTSWQEAQINNKQIWDKLISLPAIQNLDELELVYCVQEQKVLEERYKARKNDDSLNSANFKETCLRRKKIYLESGIPLKCYLLKEETFIKKEDINNNEELI